MPEIQLTSVRSPVFQSEELWNTNSDCELAKRSKAPALVREDFNIEWGEEGFARAVDADGFDRTELPILMYHGIEDVPPTDPLSPWRVSPGLFKEQLAALRQNGYQSIDIEDWWRAASTGKSLPAKVVLITFDDAYANFLNGAYPILEEYGFTATVFVPTDYIGRSAEWDAKYNRHDELLNNQEIRFLSEQGIKFASHTKSHPWLTVPSPTRVLEELRESRERLEALIGESVDQIAYPYGDHNDEIVELASEAGYEFGFIVGERKCGFSEHRLKIPRLTVLGNEGLKPFIDLLGLQALSSTCEVLA